MTQKVSLEDRLKSAQFNFDFSQISVQEHPESSGVYFVTNECVDQIVAALNPQGNEKVLGIIGGFEQGLGILEKLSKGHFYGFDCIPFAIVNATIKIELMSVLNRDEYIRYLTNQLTLTEFDTIWEHLCKIPSTLHENLRMVISSSTSFITEIPKGVEFLNNDEKYQKILANLKNITLFEQDARNPFNFPNDFFDMAYLSNIVDYNSIPDWINHIGRVLKTGARIYVCTAYARGTLDYLKKHHITEDKEAYERGMKQFSGGIIGNLRYRGDFLVGIKK